MKGKVCVITGANAGLGFETAMALAKKEATVLLLCRSVQKGATALDQIVEESGNTDTHLVQVDLASQASIRAAAAKITGKWPVIDVLVNNAAAVISEHTFTEDGIETQFAVNHLAYFLMTHFLLKQLQKSPSGRIINVSSRNHFHGKIHFGNFNLRNKYQILRAYNQSKLANVLFTYELNRRLDHQSHKNISVHCVDPGTNKTAIGHKHTRALHSWLWSLRLLFGGHDPEIGAATQLHIATSDKAVKMSGRYWYRKSVTPSAPRSYDHDTAARLWEESKKLCGITDYFQPIIE